MCHYYFAAYDNQHYENERYIKMQREDTYLNP